MWQADHRTIPDIIPVLRRFQDVLDHLEPQEDKGDLTGLTQEIEDWAPLRRAATTVLLTGW